tara:strand:- start:180 stop:446 length:267 start_codon:yes stop_codon:yes gene_type:complete
MKDEHIITINKIELACELAENQLKQDWSVPSFLRMVGIKDDKYNPYHNHPRMYHKDEDGTMRYTEQAQDVFNKYYDDYLTLIEKTIKK